MYSLPPLPYAHDALQPVIGELTMQTHHGKHHARYVNVTNEIVGNSTQALEDVVRKAHQGNEAKLFNNAAQAWNHAFFWESMTPSPAAPAGALLAAIDGAFGSLEGLKKEFVAKGAAQFGSGWAWLVSQGGKLAVTTTHDAGVPWLADGVVPLLVCDVWEHAYYLDYRNERDRFLSTWFDKLANWGFAAKQLAGERYHFPKPA
jgi:Fe-Mn family superoxide dismutase